MKAKEALAHLVIASAGDSILLNCGEYDTQLEIQTIMMN